MLHMGDTDIFHDMALIHEVHEPAIGFVPIGDRFTMGGELAARACRSYFRFDTVVPIHYGTFPLLTGTPDALRELTKSLNVEIVNLQPGETLD